MNNFWTKLNKPFFVLAPMADVTDCVFRQIIAKYGSPDVFWTEFVSADGLAHPLARKKLLIDLKFDKNEHPIVAQIFGSNIDNIRDASKLCVELGFDGVDINMGCPDKSIEKQGAGAGCIKNPELSKKIVRAAKECGLPVSVKTRIGYNKNEINTWIRSLLEENLAVLTVHLRTRKEMSLVPAHWDLMPEIIRLRDEISPNTLIIGNGDVVDLEDAQKKISETGCDGVMLGRAIFGNPWLFTWRKDVGLLGIPKSDVGEPSTHLPPPAPPLTKVEGKYTPTLNEKLEVLVEHIELFEKELGGYKNFAIMKKHYKAYVNGFDGAKELRMELMETTNSQQAKDIVDKFLEKM
ncbi:MAG: tRNA-dihydrouridine synthase [bacterium]|nr:tRNA-dihydrouridine synthase [bacterium]